MKQVQNIKNKLSNIKIGKALFVALIMLLVVAAVLVNIVAVKLESRFSLVGDLTGNSAYRVGQETKMVLKTLNKDVEIYVLAEDASFTGDSYLVQANKMIKEYSANSSFVSLAYVNYVLEPTFVSQYPDLVLEQGNILVTCEGNTEQIKLVELFNYQKTTDGNVVIVSSKTEEVITSAILNVISDVRISVAMLKGNGVAEKLAFGTLLAKNGFVVSDVNMAIDALDRSFDIAILIAPQIDLSEATIKKIDDFLYNGGEYGKMLFYTADVTQEPLPLLEAYLKEWGVVVGDGAVFETKAERTYQSQPFYLVADYAEQEYRALLIDSAAPMMMPLSRPLETLFDVRDKQYTKILLMFADTVGVRPSDGVDFAPQQSDKWGPMPALIMASKKIRNPDGIDAIQSNILVSASSEMLDTFSIDNTSLANSEYLIKLINSVFGKEQSVAIVPKSLAGDTLTINTKQKNIIGIVFSIIIPFIILAVGIAIFTVRRHK